MRNFEKRIGRMIVAPSVAILLSVDALSDTALAQDEGANSDPQPGTIIVLREVTYGTALSRPSEGEALEVEVGPQRILLSAVTQGLLPLTDAEQAGIFAATRDPIRNSIGVASSNLRHIETAIGTGLGQQRGQSSGGAISRALSELPSVGAIVRDSLGSGQ